MRPSYAGLTKPIAPGLTALLGAIAASDQCELDRYTIAGGKMRSRTGGGVELSGEHRQRVGD